MGLRTILLIAVATIAALGLFVVVKSMAAGKKATTQVTVVAAPEKPTIKVLVASRDLPVGTRLAPTDVRWQGFPADSLNAAYITDGAPTPPPPVAGTARVEAKATAAAKAAGTFLTGGGAAVQALTGAIVRESILASEPIIERKIVHGGQGGYMSVVLQPGMRALAVPVTVETGAGGFILPGDRVDVLTSRKADQARAAGSDSPLAETILRNIRVLAIDQQVQPEKNARSIVGATATLELPADQVETVLRAKAQGDLALALRSYADLGDSAGPVENIDRGDSVKVIRAGRVSEVMTK